MIQEDDASSRFYLYSFLKKRITPSHHKVFFNKVFQQIEIDHSLLCVLFQSEVRNCSGTEEGRVWCRTNHVRDNKSIRITRTLYHRNQAEEPFMKTVRRCVYTTALNDQWPHAYLTHQIHMCTICTDENLFPLQTGTRSHFPSAKLHIL